MAALLGVLMASANGLEAQAVPSPWTAQDVGGPALAGSATYSAGTFSVSAAGVDIWDNNDQFQFVYRTLDGDGEIVALVSSLQNTDPWTKGGVMFREDLTSNAPNALALVSAGNGMVFQQRVTRDGTTTGTFPAAVFGGAAPYWVRVVRSGNTFTGYTSATGTAWTLMGSSTVPMALHAYVGLAVTSGNPSVVTNARFSNVTVITASGSPPPSLTSLTPTAGTVGSPVTVTGANFGTTQGASTVTFNGMPATPTSWSGTSLGAPVPSGATTGNIVVMVGGQASNGISFTVTAPPPPPPSLTAVSPTSGAVGTSVTITGANFGSTQGTSAVRFNGTAATPTSWSSTRLVAPVPSGATTGNVVVRVGGQVSNGVSFTVNAAPGLPVPWTAQDVGGPALAGSATYSAGTFSVSAAGVDIWDNNDQFQFVYRTLDGDGEIVALVSSLQNTDPWTKGGVMFRGDLTSSAPNALALVSAGNGMVFQRRVTRDGTTTGTFPAAVFGGAAPYWVRVVRSGNTFTGYTSATGTAWTLMGSSTVPMALHAYVGLAVTSGNPSVVTNARFSNVTVITASGSPPPSLTSLTPTAGTVGSPVTVTGANFGTTQGASTVTFNGMPATPTSWSSTSVTAPVPSGATTGNVTVTVGGQASNAVAFTVTPTTVVVTASWNANTEADLAGYVLAYGTQTRVYSSTADVGNVTTWQVPLTGGVRYYFAVKAYNTSLQFSPYSAEVVFDVPTFGPAPSGMATANQMSAANAGVSVHVGATAVALAPATAISDPTLAAFWQLNDGVGTTAFDASGNGKNGSLVNGPLWTTGLHGGLSFDGIDDHITTGFVENLATWTVAVWVRSPAAPSPASGSGPVDRGKNFQIDWNHPDAAFRGAVALSAGGTWYAASFGPLAAETWYHLVGTYDGGTLRAYVNGVLASENAVPSATPDLEPLPLQLGARGTPPSYFAGVINGVRIYRRAISATDIAALAQPDATPPTPVTLSATPNGQGVSLSWTAAADPNSGVSLYRIYRGTTAGGTKTPLAEGPATALSYQDRRIAPLITYYYAITAVNGAGVEGPASNEANAVAGDIAPAQPAGLTPSPGAVLQRVSLSGRWKNR